MCDRLEFSIRGVFGVKCFKGLENPAVVYEHSVPLPDFVRFFQYSNRGDYLAFCDGIKFYVIETATSKELICHPLAKVSEIVFSPRDKLLAVFEPYVIYGLRRDKEGNLRSPNPNLHFFSLSEKKHLLTTISRKNQGIPQWTADEKFMIAIDGSEVRAFEANLEKSKFKQVISNIHSISVSPNQSEHLFAAYIPGSNGSASKVELRRINSDMTVFSTAVFMNCDKMNFMWNSKGSALLAHATVEVDQSGQSYYGKSYLQVLNCNSEKGKVNFDKEGPLHDVKWSPSGLHFVVVYGFMPAKVAMFTSLGNKCWDIQEDGRNEIHFNPQGTLLATCGFGSLAAGKIQVWDVEARKELNSIEVANTTIFKFSADGQHFLTATTAPRMRVDNCYRLWHYSGRMLFEHVPERYELWDAIWRPLPQDGTPKFVVETVSKNDKLKSGLHIKKNGVAVGAAGAVKKSNAYVPPAMRKGNEGALKPASVIQANNNDKKIKKLEKDLRQIDLLKEKQAQNGTLEKNQLEKIGREAEFRELLQKLQAESAA